MSQEVIKIKKRDGRIVNFDQKKITQAIFKALTITGQGDDKTAKKLSDKVIKIINRRFKKGEIPDVEQIQDITEEVLILEDLVETAKSYILYREQRRRMREADEIYDEAVEIYDKYIDEMDWQVKENSNMAYSLQGLNNYGVSTLTRRYWLNKIYPKQIREAVQGGDFHIHDLDSLATYCCGWDLYDLLKRGFGGVPGKVEANPPKHLRSALGQVVNFFFTLQGEIAGAIAFSNFDTLLAPFIRYDKLNYKDVKQCLQEFLFNCAIPTRVGFQNPFSNVTLDIRPSSSYAKQPVIIGGELQKETYGEFQEEMNVFNKAFYKVMMQGDKSGRVFTFPIPTINITEDFPWDDPIVEPMWQATAKYGLNYFANFIQSDMSPEDARSMCCRLRLDNRELLKRGGGLFGANPLTGSIGVVTINLPRLGYTSKTKKEFFKQLDRVMDLAKESLEIKRKAIEDLIRKGLYPYSKHYLESVEKMRGSYYGNHFSTIGLLGMNECLLNFMGEDIGSENGKKFALEIMDHMRERIVGYQEQTDNLYNLEATPAEGASYKLCLKDRIKYPNIITAGTKDVPYYTNSTQLPVNFTEDIFQALELQDELQCKYTGGCIEKGNRVLTDKGLLNIEYIVKNFQKLKPIKALSYNIKKKISEWDKIIKAVSVDVKKHDKIRVKGERNLDITTSDWHPFFVLKRFKPNPACPICETKVKNLKAFATHIRWNEECRDGYKDFPKYHVIEKRADELQVGDYILQNSANLYTSKKTELNKELMWLIGFFIGDGSISQFFDNRGGNNIKRYKVIFFSEHQKALQKVADIINKYFDCQINVRKNDKRSESLREVSTSKRQVVDFFFKYGFKSGKKVYNISISRRIKDNMNKENVFSLLSGLFDSDGHISKRDSDFEYYTVSSQLADDILEICTRAGVMVSKTLKLTKRENEVDIWRLRIPNYEIYKIKDELEITVNHTRIPHILSNRKKRHLPVVRVKKVSKVDVKDNQFYDLMIEKNHNYLSGKDCLVFIHNTVVHLFLGEQIRDIEAIKALIKKAFSQFKLPYITLTPTFSICPSHGYLSGKHWLCPKCTIEQKCEVYSRIVGYIRPLSQWHEGKAQEFKDREVFKGEGL